MEATAGGVPPKRGSGEAILEVLPNAVYSVACDDGAVIHATISGRLRAWRTLAVGDRVTVQTNPYDAKRGRIIGAFPWR